MEATIWLIKTSVCWLPCILQLQNKNDTQPTENDVNFVRTHSEK